MKLSNRLFVTASLIICGALVSTSFCEPNTPKKAADANASEPNAVKADSVAVTVNGENIMESQVEEEIGPRLKSMAGQVPPERLEAVKQQLRGKAVEGLVIKSLLDTQVAKNDIKVSDEDVNAEIAKQLQQQNMTEDDLKKILTMYGKSFDWYKVHIKKTLGYQKFFENKMGSSADVNDAAAEAYYTANIEQFKNPEQVRASHILISSRPTDPNQDPNVAKAQAKAKAEDVLKQLKGGADFNDLAKKYSADPGSAEKGGDLGYFGKGQMVKPFEDAAFGQKTGETSGLVETQFGYHIIKTTGHNDANTVSFEQAKPQIKEMLANQKKGQAAQQIVEDLKKNAKIEYPAGKEPVAPTMPMMRQPAPEASKPADADKK